MKRSMTLALPILLALGAAAPVAHAQVETQSSPTTGMNSPNQMRFRTYVMERRITPYAYSQPVAVGVVLPESGVQYYDVPAEYGVPNYRYTVVNDHIVLVDPSTRRIVQVIGGS
jgi:hypothetical protein